MSLRTLCVYKCRYLILTFACESAATRALMQDAGEVWSYARSSKVTPILDKINALYLKSAYLC